MRRDAVVAALCIVALLVGALLTAKQSAPPKVPTRASTDYEFGGYRAFYELLAREDAKTGRFHQHHDELGPDTDTLVLAFPDKSVNVEWDQAEKDAIRTWVRAGGRLIDIGDTPSTGHDDLKAETILGEQVAVDRGALSGPWSQQVKKIGPRGFIRLRVTKGHHAQTLLADRAGPLVMRYRLGKGDVIAVAAAALFENRYLSVGDNARLAFLAAQPRHAHGVVAFDEAIRGDIVAKAWYRAIDVPERLALGILALAGLLWLAYGFFRLGPPIRTRAPREPTSREFVDAVAALYRRARARGHARDALLADVLRNLARAPKSAENVALLARANATATRPFSTDAELVGLAILARTSREDTIRAGRHPVTNRRRTSARGPGPGYRRE